LYEVCQEEDYFSPEVKFFRMGKSTFYQCMISVLDSGIPMTLKSQIKHDFLGISGQLAGWNLATRSNRCYGQNRLR
jgi:hypothetical protein